MPLLQLPMGGTAGALANSATGCFSGIATGPVLSSAGMVEGQIRSSGREILPLP